MYYVGVIGGAGSSIDYSELAQSLMTKVNDDRYTVTGYSFGAADGARRIICRIHWVEDSGHSSVSSVTIGGVSATIHDQTGHSGGLTGFGIALVSAVVPSGTSGTITVFFGSTTATSVYLSGARVVGLANSSPSSINKAFSSSTSTSISTSIDVPQGGIIFSGFTSSTNASSDPVTWGGIDQVYQSSITVRVTGASRTGMNAETGRVISCSVTTHLNSGNGMVAMSWV